MKRFLRKTLSVVLTLSLVWTLGISAAASEALGEDLTTKDTLLNEQTELSTNVFWSSAYSDLRTENLVTYSPNSSVTPIITYGGVLTGRSTVSASAKALEDSGGSGDFLFPVWHLLSRRVVLFCIGLCRPTPF